MTDADKLAQRKFWSDDFDIDLLKIFPETPAHLERPHQPVWTFGNTTYGRLNHPTVWNTHGAFLWTQKPVLPRDKNGWVNIGGCVTEDPLVEATWLEFLRDAWAHHYNWITLPANEYFLGMDYRWFSQIMYHRRGWDKLISDTPLNSLTTRAWRWLMACDAQFSRIYREENNEDERRKRKS